MDNNVIQIGELKFEPYLSQDVISRIVNSLSKQITQDYRGQDLLAIVVLKGGYLFAADLLRSIEMDIPVYFIQLSSYADTRSTGHVSMNLTSLPELADKHVLIIEDIVETGLSMSTLLDHETFAKVSSIEICSLLVKPTELKTEINIKYIGKSIPPAFVVGYGLDYNELGRHLPDIYQLKE